VEAQVLAIWKYGEYDRILECLQVTDPDVMADGDGDDDGDGDSDDAQRLEVTIDTTESRRGSYNDWGFH
jgi:hypothetical protein